MAAIRLVSDGTLILTDLAGGQRTLPRGIYLWTETANRTGELRQYIPSEGMAGFWSSIGSGFASVGKWIGNNFGTIATAGAAIYAIHSGVQLGGGQQNAQQQAEADAAAQQAAQAQQVAGGSLDLSGILPIAIIGVILVMLLKR